MSKKKKFRCLECGASLTRDEVRWCSSLGGNDDRYWSCISCLGVCEEVKDE